MRLLRLVLPIVAAAGAVSLLAAAPASAQTQTYPPGPPSLTIADATPFVGDPDLLTGAGYLAGEQIQIVVDYQGTGGAQGAKAGLVPAALTIVPRNEQFTVTADAGGGLSRTMVFTQPGPAVVTATGQTSGTVQSVTVFVQSRPGGLPKTGMDGTTYLGLSLAGLGAIIVGSMLVAWAIRRRRHAGNALRG